MRAFVLLAILLLGCERELDDTSPEGSLALFLNAIERSENEPSARLRAFELLDTESQRRLTERARIVTALGGRDYAASEMLVEGRALLRFTPRRSNGLRGRLDENDASRAVVVVSGAEPGQRALVSMLLEQGSWRVVLEVPELRAEGAR